MRRWFAAAAVALALAGPVAAGPKETLTDLLLGARVGKAESFRNLAVYVLELPGAKDLPGHRTLDEALADGTLSVTEVSESGSVNELLVENTGKQPVFIMAGEILKGSKQDRVLQDDVWLPAASGPVRVACFCVEAGRWTYESDKFSSRPVAANVAVRAKARAEKEQSAVWDEVAATQSRAGYSSSTALGKTYEAPEVRQDLQGYLDALRDLPARNPRARGVIVLISGHPLAVDLFGSRDDFVSLWPKLLPSYALEATQSGGSGGKSPGNLVKEAAAAQHTTVATPGGGTLLEIRGSSVVGSALVVGSTVAHVEIFPGAGVPRPEPQPLPIQRQY